MSATIDRRGVRRIVAGQGPIQLVTALTAMDAHARRWHDPAGTFEDYLVMFDLFAPEGREAAFVGTLRAMAAAVSAPSRGHM